MKMILLFDIGNTHTHIGLADDRRVLKQTNIPTLRLVWRRRGGAREKICRRKIKSPARFCAASCRARRRSSAKPSAHFGNWTRWN